MMDENNQVLNNPNQTQLKNINILKAKTIYKLMVNKQNEKQKSQVTGLPYSDICKGNTELLIEKNI